MVIDRYVPSEFNGDRSGDREGLAWGELLHPFPDLEMQPSS
jgi:hypothetical protein